jgi:hypothetical protein
MTFALASVTVTLSGSGNACDGGPLCRSPLFLAIACGAPAITDSGLDTAGESDAAVATIV